MTHNNKRISLYATGKEDVQYGTTPVTFGVPFPEGELENKDNVRLVDSEGEDFPVQTDILARWNPDLICI